MIETSNPHKRGDGYRHPNKRDGEVPFVPSAGSTFAEHKEQTAKDLESLIEMLTQLAAEVREGNMKKWEEFWYEGGTEEGDAKMIFALREMLILRYAHREESIESNDGGQR